MEKHIFVWIFVFIMEAFILLVLCFSAHELESEYLWIIIHSQLDKRLWFELNFYLFMASSNRCDGSSNSVQDLFGGISVPSKIEYIDFKYEIW